MKSRLKNATSGTRKSTWEELQKHDCQCKSIYSKHNGTLSLPFPLQFSQSWATVSSLMQKRVDSTFLQNVTLGPASCVSDETYVPFYAP